MKRCSWLGLLGLLLAAAAGAQTSGPEYGTWKKAARETWVLPELDQNQLPDLLTGAAASPTEGFLVGPDRRSLVLWPLTGGPSVSVPLPEKVFGLAWYAGKNLLMLRFSKTLASFDPASRTLTKTLNFAKASAWTPLSIAGTTLFALEDNQVQSWNLSNLQQLSAWTAPRERIQNLAALNDGTLVLWSSYSGNRLFRVSAAGRLIEEETGHLPHRALFKLANLADGRLAVLDPNTRLFLPLIRVGPSWLPADDNLYLRSDGQAYRILDRQEPLTGRLNISAAADSPAFKALVALPALTAWGQTLDQESLPIGQIKTDVLGNRYLEVEIPALAAGETWSADFYQASLTRYRAGFNLAAAGPWRELTIPEDMKFWLQDRSEYGLAKSPLKEEREALSGLTDSPADFLQTAFLAVQANLHYDQDGIFDTAPVTWGRGSGGCTEYARVFVNLMRGSAIPSRIARNWLPVDGNHPAINHKVAEGWLPGVGWFPMEALAPPKTLAGATSGLHLVFNVLEKDRDGLIPHDGMFALPPGLGKLVDFKVIYTLPERPSARSVGQTAPAAGEVTPALVRIGDILQAE